MSSGSAVSARDISAASRGRGRRARTACVGRRATRGRYCGGATRRLDLLSAARPRGIFVNSLTTNDLFSVSGKVVLVTGGSRGIGEMIAAGFLANGAKVYISSRKADACDATAEAPAARATAASASRSRPTSSQLEGVERAGPSSCRSARPPRRPGQQRRRDLGRAASTSSPRSAGTRSWTPTSRASSS